MTKYSDKNIKAFDGSEPRSNIFTFNKDNYFEYGELFYSIEKYKNSEFAASVYGLPALFTDKNSSIDSCIKKMTEKIDRYIFEHKIKLLNYPRPIPDGIDLITELIKTSGKYELRTLATISLRNALRQINEETIKILNKNYKKITQNELDKVLELETIYTYNHGIIIKKLISGLILYDCDSGRQINISDIFTNWQNPSDLFCIFIPNNTISSIEFESNHSEIEHYPCQKTNTYKFILKPSSSLDSINYPIKIKSNNHTKRTYLTITKINSDNYSYTFEGSEDFNTGNGSIHLCAKKNFTDKLSSIFPESISEYQPQRFELFIFEFSKFLQYAMLKNYADHELYEYTKVNRPISPNCYNLLIIKDDLDRDYNNEQNSILTFIDIVTKTNNTIDAKNSVSEHDFSILREALQKSDELNLDEQTIKKCTINCWRYIQSLPEYDIYAKIVLLKIDKGLPDNKIFQCLCDEYKNFTVLRKYLHIREENKKLIKNEYNIINSRYKYIYDVADEFNLPHPQLSKNNKKSN